MHASVMSWLESQVARHALRERSVLEVGSLVVNGSPRWLFKGPYVGVDMRGGAGVDVILNAHALASAEAPAAVRGPFDAVVCTEMLEHDSAPWLSLEAMRAVASTDALLLLTCRGYDARGCFPLHGFPEDLWRFSVQGVVHLLALTGWRPVEAIADPDEPGVFALARADGEVR